MKNIPFWLDSAPPFTGAAAGELPARADVAVIGGGFCGLAAALALAKKGRQLFDSVFIYVFNEATDWGRVDPAIVMPLGWGRNVHWLLDSGVVEDDQLVTAQHELDDGVPDLFAYPVAGGHD